MRPTSSLSVSWRTAPERSLELRHIMASSVMQSASAASAAVRLTHARRPRVLMWNRDRGPNKHRRRARSLVVAAAAAEAIAPRRAASEQRLGACIESQQRQVDLPPLRAASGPRRYHDHPDCAATFRGTQALLPKLPRGDCDRDRTERRDRTGRSRLSRPRQLRRLATARDGWFDRHRRRCPWSPLVLRPRARVARSTR